MKLNTLIALAFLLTGCPEESAFVHYRIEPLEPPDGEEICTRDTSIDDERPAEQRCFQAHCYSNQHAPRRTTGRVLEFGTGNPNEIPINWGPIDWVATIPDVWQHIVAEGSGCYDCPATQVGSVGHAAQVTPAGPVNTISFGCNLLNRPATASNQVDEQDLTARIGRCLERYWGYEPDRQILPLADVWYLGSQTDWNADVPQRSDIGRCVAEICSDMNTFVVDRDNDAVGDACDNCVSTPNQTQSNIAGTWLGDHCEDTDGDGALDFEDACVFSAQDMCDANDPDSDGTPGAADNCPNVANANQADFNNNGIGDACEDSDGDGTLDQNDHCPERAGPCQDDYDDNLDACEVDGSIVGVEAQTLGETIDLPGSGLFLRYASQRVPGFHPSGAPARDARDFGFGGWSLNAQHHWEDSDPPRILVGAGGNFPVTRVFEHADGTLVPDPSDAIAYVFDAPRRHIATVDAIDGRVLLRFEYDGADLIGVTDANGQRTRIDRNNGAIVLHGPLDDINRLTVDDNGYLASVTQPGGRRWDIAHGPEGLLDTIAPPRVAAAGGAARHRFTYNADGQLIGDEGLDGEALRLVRTAEQALNQVDLYRAMDTQDGEVRELKTSYRTWLSGTRSVEFAEQRSSTRALEDDELQGFASGYRTRTADGGTRIVLIDDGDRWAGGESTGRMIVTPAEDTELDAITVDTQERVVLANDGPLGAQSINRIETTIRQGDAESRSVLYPQGRADRFDGAPFVESTSAEGRQSTVVMENGKITQVQAGNLHPVRYTYDERGRVETIRQGPEGLERVTWFDYFEGSHAVRMTAPNGRLTLTTFNAALDLERIENRNLGDDLHFEYDAGGALNALHTQSGTHTWQMTAGGRVESYTAPPGFDQPNGSTTRYEWALDGRPVAVTEADGRETGFIYGETGLIEQIETPGQTIAHQWRADLQLQDVEVSERVLRDGTSIELTERPLYFGSRPYGTALQLTVDGTTHHLSQSVTLDRGTWEPRQIEVRDANGRRLQTELTFDRDGGLTGLGDLSIDLSAQGVGLPGLSQIGEIRTERTFSQFGEMDLLRVITDGPGGYFLHLTRDPRSGEVTGFRECFGGEACKDWDFEFDPAGRLTRAQSGNTEYAYTYDLSGRRTERRKNQAVEDTWYDAQDRLLRYGNARFEYNPMGQRVWADNTPTGDWTYEYDVQGGLRSVEGDDVVVEYVLDSAGRRIGRREDNGALTWWMYDGLHPIAEFDDQLRLRKRFYYGVRGHVPEYMTTHDAGGVQTGRYHFVTNLVGSVVGVLDDAGNWVERTNYSPFGRPEVVIEAPEAVRHPFGFAGGFTDEATGLVRFGARDYDPYTGQWLAKDPIRFAGGDPNLYGYVGQDPVRFFDPSGLQAAHLDFDRVGGGIRPRLPGSGGLAWTSGPPPPWLVTVGGFILEEVLLNYATGGVFTLGKWAFKGVRALRTGRKAKKASKCNELRLPRSLGAAANINVRSRIGEIPYAIRQAGSMSAEAQRDVDAILAMVRQGNMNPGIGTKGLGDAFFELRGRNGGRVIVKQLSAGVVEVVGKFQAHARGKAANSAIIQTLKAAYNAL